MPVISGDTSSLVVTGGSGGTGSVPCADWPVFYTCDVSTVDPVLLALTVTSATQILWALSGRRFGFCEVTSRPCRDDCYDYPFYTSLMPWSGSYPQPALIGGSWFNLTCGSCSRSCTCGTLSEVLLPSPVLQVVRVMIDGTIVPTGSYRLDDNRRLVRTDGGMWPICNDLARDDTEPGTWSITALYGEPIPEMAKLAMGELVCELIRGATGGDCRLPPGVTQLARQGVTISYPDVGTLWKQGRTGLFLVDAFLSAFNPAGLTRRSRTYSVDRPPFRRAGT